MSLIWQVNCILVQCQIARNSATASGQYAMLQQRILLRASLQKIIDVDGSIARVTQSGHVRKSYSL